MSDKVLFIKDKNEVIIQGVSFKCPNNWIMCPMSEADLEFANGNYAEKYPKKEEILSAGVPFFRANNIKDGYIIAEDMVYISKEKHEELQRGHLKTGDVIIAIRGNIGKSGMITEVFEGANLNAQLSVIRSKDKEKIIPAYINYMCLSPMLQMQFEVYTTGTALKQLSEKNLHSCIIAIPPIAEQQRIVEQIESLFAKLDEAKEKVLEVITSSQCRKDSLLHKAFEGVLTSRWRDKNKVVLENKYYSFDECIKKMQNGLAKRSGSTGKEFAVIRLANLSTDGFITEDLRMILLDEKEQENYRLYENDVVMIRVNGSKDNVARQICVESDTEWAFCDHIIRIKYDETKVLPRFMVYFSKSQSYRNYIADNMVSSAGQNTISRKGMANLLVPKIVLEEQEEIIKILDKLWKAEDEIQIKSEQVIEQIDLMKKSILAKAFRGELGTNNPDEESAVELLKSILATE